MITKEHFAYLDRLRESGETNMFGATPYVEKRFKVSKSDARHILKMWMETYSEKSPAERAELCLKS